MVTELSFASIRQGDIAADQAWELLSPLLDTRDQALAIQICEVLRSWTWKALDRRRRDSALREWVDLLNRVEAFFAENFANIAAKLELLADLIHESIAVAELASPEDIVRRKHVAPILGTLLYRDGEWIERGDLMAQLKIKPANMTRLMTLLVDLGWAEQVINGREASYRISAEGAAHARLIEQRCPSEFEEPCVEVKHWRWELDYIRPLVMENDIKKGLIIRNFDHSLFDLDHPQKKWEVVGQGVIGAIEIDDDEDEEADLVKMRGMHSALPLVAMAGGSRW